MFNPLNYYFNQHLSVYLRVRSRLEFRIQTEVQILSMNNPSQIVFHVCHSNFAQYLWKLQFLKSAFNIKIETKDIVRNMNWDPSLLGSFSANAFILLAIKGQDSSALQLYKDFEKDLNVNILTNYSSKKTEASQQSKEIFNNFLKKNGINLEEKI